MPIELTNVFNVFAETFGEKNAKLTPKAAIDAENKMITLVFCNIILF
jgi:hypothetical protein